ncbi:hypothetical protein DSO57_1003588 [Entomophthora muscae]|uniref:Uncharacterized protein n=1 Tax=Entomophthora muscae TaxID=34485 RepID=A0ACC2TVE9_9FUNG|nr:hypothetical protein DSO57_1003588 [Entomophthora muscae]
MTITSTLSKFHNLPTILPFLKPRNFLIFGALYGARTRDPEIKANRITIKFRIYQPLEPLKSVYHPTKIKNPSPQPGYLQYHWYDSANNNFHA